MVALLLSLVLQGDPTKDAVNLEGTWVIVSAVTDGKPNDDIKGEKLTFKDGKATISSKSKEEGGTYKIDATKKPTTIDFKDANKDKPYLGLYKLDGDKLTLCVPEDTDGARPKDFTAKEGEKLMLIELKREKK